MSLLARALDIFGAKGASQAPPAPNDDDRAKLRAQLQRDEGCRLAAYRDSEGFLTVGFGHNLDADTVLRDRLAQACGGDVAQITVSRETAERLLDTDIALAEDDVRRALPWSTRLDACRFGVLVNMTFNMGIGSVASGKGLLGRNPEGLAACKAGDYARAADEMLDGNWKHQVGPRAHRLARQMREGTWV